MLGHMHFTLIEVVWTLTFAALIVLMVVLLGRDRMARYPWFTASIALVLVQMLSRRMLADKLDPLASAKFFLLLGDAGVLISLFVAIELARRAFTAASRAKWLLGTLLVLGVAVGVVAWWGPWPARETLLAHSTLAHLHMLQLIAEKGDLINSLVFIELALLAMVFVRRLRAGWRNHALQILLGFLVASVAQVGVRVVWEFVSKSGPPTSEAEFLRRSTIETRLLAGTNIAYLVVVIAWIACLWIDEPGSGLAPATVTELSMDAATQLTAEPGKEPDQKPGSSPDDTRHQDPETPAGPLSSEP
jgi:hypothetical protein